MDPKFQGMLEEDVYEIINKDPKRKSQKTVGIGQFASQIGELTEGFSRDPMAGVEYENRLDRQIEKAVIVAKQQGKCPGWASEYVFENRQSKINWKNKLRRFLNNMMRRGGDLTWARPIKRLLYTGTVLPSDNMLPGCDIFCGFDTSGSMGKAEIDACVSELNAIFREFNGSVNAYNIWFNARVWHAERINKFQAPTKIEGGGTDFQVVFDHIEENKLKPRCLIMLTDMYCNFPPKPRYPVLWVATSDIEAPYGETIRIKV